MRRELKQIIFAVFLLIFMQSVAPTNLLNAMGIQIDVYAATLNNPRIVTDSSMTSGQIVTWDCVWFGSYPQTEIVDQVSTSGCYGRSWSTSSDYEVNASLYISLQNATFDSNGDTTIGNAKYRRIKESDVTFDDNFSISNSGYYNWSDSDTYHYFRYEPIKWRVLNVNGSQALLLADIALDAQSYNNSLTSYDTVTIRSWLNGYGSSANGSGIDYSSKNFIGSAFTTDERNAIVTTTINIVQFISTETNDKIFLLSGDEAFDEDTVSYGFVSNSSTEDEGRRSKSSSYAKAMGLYSNISGSDLGNCRWWLRSPGNLNSYVGIQESGNLLLYSVSVACNNHYGCRPALNLNVSSTNLWSYAGTVCSDGIVTEPTYAVSYNANGGSGSPSSQTKKYGVNLTLSNTIPTRSGYTFVGWGTSSTATSLSYAAGGTYSANEDITLYAIWKKTITLTYNANGGSGAPSSQSATIYNAESSYTFTISNIAPTQKGYTFLGWSKDSSDTTYSYRGGNNYTFSSNVTLYAIWEANDTDSSEETTYTLTYDANGGQGAPVSRSGIVTGTTIELSSLVPTRNGYTFNGWSEDKTATSAGYGAGDQVLINRNLTLYAVWKANPVTPANNTPSSTTPAKQQQVITASSMNVAYKSGPFYLGATTNGNGTLSYSSTNPGVASISSTGLVTVYQYGITQINIAASETANFTAASTSVTITVGPQAVKITKATSKKKKQLVLTWKKNKEATGYQMYISLSPNFDTYTFARACSKKYVKYTFTGLKSKKVYYVKSRSYKKIGGIYYFGPWSVVKAVKVK